MQIFTIYVLDILPKTTTTTTCFKKPDYGTEESRPEWFVWVGECTGVRQAKICLVRLEMMCHSFCRLVFARLCFV